MVTVIACMSIIVVIGFGKHQKSVMEALTVMLIANVRFIINMTAKGHAGMCLIAGTGFGTRLIMKNVITLYQETIVQIVTVIGPILCQTVMGIAYRVSQFVGIIT